MAATYVQITREEMHEWLDSAEKQLRANQWIKVEGKEGVYIIPLSPAVGLQISTSIGSRDTAMAVGQAAIHSKLVSRITGDVLNKKAAGQSRVNRTKGWAEKLLLVAKKLVSAYQKSPKFYEIIAQKGGMEGYLKQWMEEVKSLPWESSPRLQDIQSQLAAKRILSDQDEQFVRRFTDERIPDDIEEEAPKENPEIGDWVSRIEAIKSWEKYDFLQAMMIRLMDKKRLTAPMKDVIERIESRKDPSFTSQEYRQDLVKRITSIPGYARNPFLADILGKVKKGFQMSDNQLSAINRTEAFQQQMRDKWLSQLRGLIRQFGADPEKKDLVTRIGVTLRDSGDAFPSDIEMSTLDRMFGRAISGLLDETYKAMSPPSRTPRPGPRPGTGPRRRASLADRVAILYMGRTA